MAAIKVALCTMNIYLLTTLLAGLSSALACGLFVATREHHIHTSGDVGGRAHKTHAGTVPRLGGIGVYLGMLTSSGIISQIWPSAGLLFVSALCMAPAFITGLTEDLTSRVPPTYRYIGTLLSAILLATITGAAITRTDVGMLDAILAQSTISILFFAFAFSSMAHAFNLIDGLNGLCSGVTIIISAAIAYVANANQVTEVALAACTIGAANVGFIIFNYPKAKLFLGDNGAYVNGGFLGLIAVQLIQRAPDVSPWFACIIFAYPTAETLYTIYRRLKAGNSITEPDKLHLHSLLPQLNRSAATLLWFLAASCALIGLAFSSNSTALIFGCLATGLVYRYAYRRVIQKSLLG